MNKLSTDIVIDLLNINDISLIEGILLENSECFKYIKKPTISIKKLAIRLNPSLIKYCKNPSYNLKKYALQESGLAIQYIKKPSKKLILIALQNNGLAIHYLKEQTDEYSLIAINSNLFSFFSLRKINDQILELIISRLYGIWKNKTMFSTLVIEMFINKIILRNDKIDKSVFIYKLISFATESQKKQLINHCNYKNEAKLIFDQFDSLNS
jgi:hypothetical protein